MIIIRQLQLIPPTAEPLLPNRYPTLPTGMPSVARPRIDILALLVSGLCTGSYLHVINKSIPTMGAVTGENYDVDL